jgi:hypothetical protein
MADLEKLVWKDGLLLLPTIITGNITTFNLISGILISSLFLMALDLRIWYGT